VKIQNPYKVGLIGGLGALTAILIAGAVSNLSTILTYVGAALFLALGLDPLVSWLERHRVRRPLAILIALVGVLGVFAGIVFAIVPVVIDQVTTITKQFNENIVPSINDGSLIAGVQAFLEQYVDSATVDDVLAQVQTFFTENIGNIGTILVESGVNIANGLFGALIVVILMVYFVASLSSIKRGVYQLVPASKRTTFIDIAEQITGSVGNYVMGQVTLGLINGVLSFLVLSILGVKYAILLAFVAFFGSLIPLVGTITATAIISLGTLLFTGADWRVIVVIIYYLVYMQIEAYVLSPRIMARAVKVPGVIVVIAALVGGTLLGVLGALIAIPVAASVLLIVRQVLVPRQNAL
jgi:predicted PurR-regulated permease PerM